MLIEVEELRAAILEKYGTQYKFAKKAGYAEPQISRALQTQSPRFLQACKKAGVDILALVEKDLESVKKLNPEKAIAKLYEKWQEPKNEVRNRLLLMATRCPDTIGVIEASVS